MSGVQPESSADDPSGPNKHAAAPVSLAGAGPAAAMLLQLDSLDSSASVQAVQGFVGYNARPLLFAVYVLLAILTGGLLWVIGQLFPRSMLWTMAKCPLSHAQYVQAQVHQNSISR